MTASKTYGVRLALYDGGKVKAELTSIHPIARSAQETSSELEDFGSLVLHLKDTA